MRLQSIASLANPHAPVPPYPSPVFPAGFIPASLLSPLNVAAVIEAERPLLAAAAAGAIVAQLETQGQPAQAADGADLDPSTRAAARRQALEAVLLGQQITAQVVNVDAASGRVVLSGERICTEPLFLTRPVCVLGLESRACPSCAAFIN